MTLLNRGDTTATINVSLAELGLPLSAAGSPVRDLWLREDNGTITADGFQRIIQSHSSLTFKITPRSRLLDGINIHKGDNTSTLIGTVRAADAKNHRKDQHESVPNISKSVHEALGHDHESSTILHGHTVCDVVHAATSSVVARVPHYVRTYVRIDCAEGETVKSIRFASFGRPVSLVINVVRSTLLSSRM